MKTRQPFRLGLVIGDYLKFIVFRLHHVVALLIAQLAVSFVLLAIVATFDFDNRNSLRAVALPTVVFVYIAARSTFEALVKNWRERRRFSLRGLLSVRWQGMLSRISFVVAALAVAGLVIAAAAMGLSGFLGRLYAVFAVLAGVVVYMAVIAPLYLGDLFHNPWNALPALVRNLHRIMSATLIFGAINVGIAVMSVLLIMFAQAQFLLTIAVGRYSYKAEVVHLLSDAPALLFVQLLLFLHLIAAAFVAERFREVAFGRDLRGIAETF